MGELPDAIEARLRRLPSGLRDHTERAREVARDLAERHGVDPDLADLGVAAHDLARALKSDALLQEARRHRLRLHPVERHNPILAHGAVAARWLEREDGITDRRVLEAVRCHTTGRRGMGPVAKVVFLADKLDPQKVSRFPYLDEIRSLARQSLDLALLEFLNRGLEWFLRNGELIHPASLELRNELILAVHGGPTPHQ